MSKLSYNVDNAIEPTVIPADTEVEMRIIDLKLGTSEKSGQEYISVRVDAPDFPASKDFSIFLWAPSDANKGIMTPKDFNKAQWDWKTFMEAFGIDPNYADTDTMPGARGWGIVGVKTDEQYGEQNTVKRLVRRR